MFKTVLVLLILSVLQGQNSNIPTTTQQAQIGTWLTPVDSKETAFPRYLICGAELNYFRSMMPFDCRLTKDGNKPIIIQCVGGKTIWERINGIRFKYCNFEDWDDQRALQYYGSWQWTGMKMCPKNQFVTSYSTKINEKDGVSGLALSCKNKFTGQTSNVVVREGNGKFSPIETADTKNNFAYDYQIKLQSEVNSYITGLNLLYTPYPEITNVKIEYDSNPVFEIRVEYEHKEREPTKVTNINKPDFNYTYDINARINEMNVQRNQRRETMQKKFQYILINVKGKYHGYPLKRYMAEKYNLQLLLPVIVAKAQEQQPLDVDRNVVFRLHNMANDFEFNKHFNQHIRTYDSQTYTIANCTRLQISSTIYSAVVNSQYTLTITYTSGSSTFEEKIRGTLQSQIFGRPQVRANIYKDVCY